MKQVQSIRILNKCNVCTPSGGLFVLEKGDIVEVSTVCIVGVFSISPKQAFNLINDSNADIHSQEKVNYTL